LKEERDYNNKDEPFESHLKEENNLLKDEIKNNAQHFKLKVEGIGKEKEKLFIIIQNLKQQMSGFQIK